MTSLTTSAIEEKIAEREEQILTVLESPMDGVGSLRGLLRQMFEEANLSAAKMVKPHFSATANHLDMQMSIDEMVEGLAKDTTFTTITPSTLLLKIGKMFSAKLVKKLENHVDNLAHENRDFHHSSLTAEQKMVKTIADHFGFSEHAVDTNVASWPDDLARQIHEATAQTEVRREYTRDYRQEVLASRENGSGLTVKK